jgi:proline iminopeptidase
MNKQRLSIAFPFLPVLLLALIANGPVQAFDEDHIESINGATLHFRVRGSDKANPYLLILHGGPGFSAHMFYAWGPSLEKTVNVVYLDQRGCGQSAHVAIANPQHIQPSEVKDYTITTLVQDIEGVRQALGVNKWYVLGHSWGGMLGLEYIAAHSDHVSGFVDMDGLVSVPKMTTSILDESKAKFAAGKKAGKPGMDTLLTQVAHIRALPQTDPKRLDGALGLALGPAALYFAQDQPVRFMAFNMIIANAVQPYNVPYDTLLPTDAPEAGLIDNDNFLSRDDTVLLAKVTVPTLIINGRQDGVITPVEAKATHTGIRGSELLLLDDCGHFPFADQPDKAAAAVNKFLSQVTHLPDSDKG